MDRIRILRRIDKLGDVPRPSGCIKLSMQERYRLRQRNYRILYEIEDEKQTIIVVKIGHREKFYKSRASSLKYFYQPGDSEEDIAAYE